MPNSIKIISDKQVGQPRRIGAGYSGISTRPFVKKRLKQGRSTCSGFYIVIKKNRTKALIVKQRCLPIALGPL